jgi:BirA family biotin operon repressor/biotin-[acetyl-CoA-carboxylase] ligase
MNIFEETKQWAQLRGIAIEAFKEIGSTQTQAKEKPHLQLALADQQFTGKGRFDRSWTSPPPGTALLSTWHLNFAKPVENNFSAKIGWCLLRALEKNFPSVDFCVKPPNDIWVNNKKIAGILIENVIQNDCSTFVGIGLNVFSAPSGVPDSGCLSQFTEVTTDQWKSFLDDWWQLLHEQTEAGPLTKDQTKDLFFAIKKHKNFHNLTAVLPNGSLQLDDKILSWTEL